MCRLPEGGAAVAEGGAVEGRRGSAPEAGPRGTIGYLWAVLRGRATRVFVVWVVVMMLAAALPACDAEADIVFALTGLAVCVGTLVSTALLPAWRLAPEVGNDRSGRRARRRWFLGNLLGVLVLCLLVASAPLVLLVPPAFDWSLPGLHLPAVWPWLGFPAAALLAAACSLAWTTSNAGARWSPVAAWVTLALILFGAWELLPPCWDERVSNFPGFEGGPVELAALFGASVVLLAGAAVWLGVRGRAGPPRWRRRLTPVGALLGAALAAFGLRAGAADRYVKTRPHDQVLYLEAGPDGRHVALARGHYMSDVGARWSIVRTSDIAVLPSWDACGLGAWSPSGRFFAQRIYLSSDQAFWCTFLPRHFKHEDFPADSFACLDTQSGEWVVVHPVEEQIGRWLPWSEDDHLRFVREEEGFRSRTTVVSDIDPITGDVQQRSLKNPYRSSRASVAWGSERCFVSEGARKDGDYTSLVVQLADFETGHMFHQVV